MSNPDQSPALSLEEFTHWLNDRRMLDVSEAFHAIVSRYSEATEAAAMAATVLAGWQVVPTSSTAAMQWAFDRANVRFDDGTGRTHPMDPASEFKARYAALLAAAPQAPVAGQPAEPSPAYWAVIAKCGEGVLFTEQADAQWTFTGRGAGSDGFGVPTMGDAFRDTYDAEQGGFKLVRVQIVPDAASKGDSNG